MAKSWDKFGLKWALEDYDQKFSESNNDYKASAEVVLSINPTEKKDIVMDIGSGTGISTIPMFDLNPTIESMTCIEPAEAIRVAKHKFSHETLFDSDDSGIIEEKLGVKLNPDYITHLKETRNRMYRFKDKIKFINEPAQKLSELIDNNAIEASSADKIYCFSSFHWLANNEESGRTSPGFVSNSLKGFYKALKPNGVLVFNESGLQFNYGMETVDINGGRYKGMLANDVHMLQQEFHKRFIDNLNNIFKEKGFSDKAIMDTGGKIDSYHFLFDMYSLTKILSENGFRIKKLKNPHSPVKTCVDSINYVPRHGDYLFTVLSKKAENWERFIVTAGNMRYFNHADELKELPSDKRKDMLVEAYNKTVEKYDKLRNIPHGETFATFVAEKQ